MQLRKAQEGREIDTRQVRIRSFSGKALQRRARQANRLYRRAYRNGNVLRSQYNTALLPPEIWKGLSKAEQKKWQSSSLNEKRRIVAQAEHNAMRRMRYERYTAASDAVRYSRGSIGLEWEKYRVSAVRKIRNRRAYPEYGKAAYVPDAMAGKSIVIWKVAARRDVPVIGEACFRQMDFKDLIFNTEILLLPDASAYSRKENRNIWSQQYSIPPTKGYRIPVQRGTINRIKQNRQEIKNRIQETYQAPGKKNTEPSLKEGIPSARGRKKTLKAGINGRTCRASLPDVRRRRPVKLQKGSCYTKNAVNAVAANGQGHTYRTPIRQYHSIQEGKDVTVQVFPPMPERKRRKDTGRYPNGGYRKKDRERDWHTEKKGRTAPDKKAMKKNRDVLGELGSILLNDMKKDEQIRQMQKTGQIELSIAELEERTGRAVIRPFSIPIRIKLQMAAARVSAAIVKGGIAAAKYALLLGVPLFLILILLFILSSLVGGIAGEDSANGEAVGLASGYELVAYAEQWIGVTKYIWGAGRNGPTSWQEYADCSSFVRGVFAHFGYELGWTTYEQENNGILVEGGLADALPGDIILFYNGYISSGNTSHVAIYAGDGKMIHCSGGRANTSPSTAGRGVCWGTPSGDGRPYTVRRILPEAVYGEAGSATAGYRKDGTDYTRSEQELIWAIVGQEDNGSYAGALAVISSAMNRTESASWKSLGSNALSQLTAPGQYCYSIDDHWRARLNGNVPEYVKQAVTDCLEKGIRNHSFTSFRSKKGSQTGEDAVQIGGNWFFGH